MWPCKPITLLFLTSMAKIKRKINYIVIHCSATRETQDYTFERLIADHKARGFLTCGYHRYIRRDGTVHVGREFDRVGAHVGDLNHNADSIGICYEGGLDARGRVADTRTDTQKKLLLEQIKEALAAVKASGQDPSKVKIVGHRDLSPDKDNDGVVEPHEWVKSCPCFNATEEYKNIK